MPVSGSQTVGVGEMQALGPCRESAEAPGTVSRAAKVIGVQRTIRPINRPILCLFRKQNARSMKVLTHILANFLVLVPIRFARFLT